MWHVVLTSNSIVDVFAIERGIVRARLAQSQAETVRPNELSPMLNLLKCTVGRKDCRVHQATERVSSIVCADRIEFPSIISCNDVELGLINETSNLNVFFKVGKLSLID